MSISIAATTSTGFHPTSTAAAARWWFLPVLLIAWALLYVSDLGGPEIKGEEWRRTIPGRTMMQNGDWLAPRSGGMPYVAKPPLINWVSAASFKLTGVQNEWTARLPSALLVLGATLGTYFLTRRWLGASAAFVGAAFLLSSVGVIEKGRIAELEVYYIAFTGVAFAAWLAAFVGRLNRWLGWGIAGVMLGLAMIAKGPAHLIFFYLPVIGACWATRRWRELISLPHFFGLALFFAITLAWALPFIGAYGRLMGIPASEVLGAWQQQVASRVTGEEKSSIEDWLVRGPRALVMFLPAGILLPWWWRQRGREAMAAEPDQGRLFTGLKWGIAASFLFMILLPSSSPRYVAPLLGPVALLSGWLAVRAFPTVRWRRWRRADLVTFCGNALLIAGGLKLVYTLIAHPIQRKREDIRPVATQIASDIQPQDGPLYVYHLGQNPYPFYFPPDTVEVAFLDDMPAEGVRWILMPVSDLEKQKEYFERRYGEATVAGRYTGTWGHTERGQKLVLLRFAGFPVNPK